jgi:N4-gp56 family major capsid protein
MDTQFGVNHALAVKLFSKRLFRETLKAVSFRPFIGKTSDSLVQLNPELKKVGDQITYGLRMLLTGDGKQGDETLEGYEEDLVFFSDAILINQLRHAVRSAGKMSEQRVPYRVREEARMRLSDWTADRLDTSFFNQLAGNTNQGSTKFTGNNTVTAPDSAHKILATASTGEASLSASSIFTLTLIDRGKLKADVISPKIRPIVVNGQKKHVCFLHPYQKHQLRTNTNTAQWMDIQRAAMEGGKITNNPIYTGSLGEYNNVVLHEADRIPWGGSTNASDDAYRTHTALGVDYVARAVLCGAQAAVLCTGRQTSEKMDATWVEELFDYKNKLGVAAGLIFGLKKSIFDSKDFGTITISSYSPNPNA